MEKKKNNQDVGRNHFLSVDAVTLYALSQYTCAKAVEAVTLFALSHYTCVKL